MRTIKLIVTSAAVCFALSSAHAETAETFNAAYAKAEAANKKAGELRNQWTTTSAALKDAKKAADAGNFDAAADLAKQAEALANASIAQSQREDKLWTESEIR
jgi:hypothetical protein